MVATEERYCNTGEPVVIRKPIVVTIAIAKNFIDAYHSCQGAGDGHRHDDLLANRDATILGSAGISPRSSQLVAPLCAPEKKIDQSATNQCQHKREVKRNELRHAWNKLAQPRDMCALSNRNCLHDWIARRFIVVLRKVTKECYGQEVQHDRVDDFVRSEACLQDPGNRTPHAASHHCGQKTHGDQKPRGQISERDSDPRGRESSDIKLPFGSNVEQAATESNEHGKAGENQWGRIKKCVAYSDGPGECATEEQGVSRQRVVSNDEDQDSGDGKSGDDGD